MRTRTFGRLGWPVSEIGYGLWGMGGWTGSDDARSLASLDRAIDLGCTFFDTALAYGDGRSERLLGQALARRPDARVRVATKVPPKNRKWPADPTDPLDAAFPSDHVRAATEQSLSNLGLTSLDLQQFHVWTDRWTDDDSWIRAVDDLKREGLIRAFGISVGRRRPYGVDRALRTGVVDAVQVVYNVFDRGAADDLLPLCRELGVAVIARVPFDEGSLTGTLRRGQTWPEGDFRNDYFGAGKLDETLDRVDRLARDVPSGMTMPELALRFVLAHPDVTTVIPGMRSVAHVEANLGVSDGRPLSAALLERLRGHRR